MKNANSEPERAGGPHTELSPGLLQAVERFPVESRAAARALAAEFLAAIGETERRLHQLQHEFSVWRTEIQRVEEEELASAFQEALDAEKG